ncbi:MAG TPA: DUF6766 family protein [Ornithinibacter sp.]|nr:DUF6766 family protein [Ornithinibacter sp.]
MEALMAHVSARTDRKAGTKPGRAELRDRDSAKGLRGSDNSDGKPSLHKAYGFGLVTAALFLLSWTGQFITQMMTVRAEAAQHQQAFEWPDFLSQFFASTFENWQSEFLQLVWQAAGLSLLLFWGSSQSKESDERIEVKIDRLLEERGIDPASISAQVNGSL